MADQSSAQLPLYADVFDLALSPWGASLRFGVRSPVPNNPKATQIEQNARVNMSLEHLKAMSFILTREIVKLERQSKINIHEDTLVGLICPPPDKLSPEQAQQYLDSVRSFAMSTWNSFWNEKAAITASENGNKPQGG